MARPEPFGRYQMLSRVASGGMAEVWLARSSSIGGFEKLLAIKRMHSSLGRNQAFVSMFIDEAKLTVQLNHPNVVQVFDFGQVDDDYFIAMEFVEGVDLSMLMRRARKQGQPPSVGLCVFIMRSVLDGLAHAHAGGMSRNRDHAVVHRDISPHNVLVSFNGHVKVGDFGIAKAVSEIETVSNGEIFGKLAYVSPEQVRGEAVDEATDLWSAGVVMHEILANRRLFSRENDIDTAFAVESEPIPRPGEITSEVPEELDAFVMELLDRDPKTRLRSAGKAAQRLTAIQSRHFPEATQYALRDLINELWDGHPPRLIPEPKPKAKAEFLDTIAPVRIPMGASTANLALSAMDGARQVRKNSGFTDDAPTEQEIPGVDQEFDLLTAQSLVTPSQLEVAAPVIDRSVTGLKDRFLRDPNLWHLVDIGIALIEEEQVARGLAALKLSATKFAQGGLLSQAVAIYRVILESTPLDATIEEELRRLPALQGRPNDELLGWLFGRDDERADYTEYLGLFESTASGVDVYAESPILSSLSAEQLASLTSSLVLHRFSPGDVVIKEGERGDSLYFMARGRALVSAHDFDGRKIYVSALADGDCFGEHSFFTGDPRSATVEVEHEAWVLEIDRPTLNRILQEHPTVREAVRRFYKERIAESLLAKSSLFSVLSKKARKELATHFTFETYNTGDLVIREGDRSDAFYAIKSGEVRVYHGTDELPAELARLGAGEIFGEMAAVEGTPRSASIRALSDCELLRLEASELNAMLSRNLEVRRMIEAQVDERRRTQQ